MHSKTEDIVMKNVCDFFKGDAPKYFGIDKKVVDIHRSELSYIQPNDNFMDYVFLLDDGTLLHFEFQSTYKKSDIGRFMVYDAVLYYKEGRNITTVVIYSSDIACVQSSLDIGSISYNIKPFYMTSMDGDKICDEIRKKIENKEALTKHDMISIVLLPIMSGKSNVLERIEQAVDLSKKTGEDDQMQIQAMLNLLAEKFIKDEAMLMKVKEVLNMSKISELIYQDGLEKGMEKGMEKGIEKGMEKGLEEGKINKAVETAKNALKEGLPYDLISRLTGLDPEIIEKLNAG